MRQMLVTLVLAIVLAESNAFAGESHFTLYGMGPAFAHNDPGWALRVEKRVDATRSSVDDERGLFGGRIGLEYWNAGSHWGIAMPVGFYAGAQVKEVRTSIGGGLGLWAFEMGRGGKEGWGIAPFASSTLEFLHIADLSIAIDGRISRQVVNERDDFNVYTVMFMLGRHYGR